MTAVEAERDGLEATKVERARQKHRFELATWRRLEEQDRELARRTTGGDPEAKAKLVREREELLESWRECGRRLLGAKEDLAAAEIEELNEILPELVAEHANARAVAEEKVSKLERLICATASAAIETRTALEQEQMAARAVIRPILAALEDDRKREWTPTALRRRIPTAVEVDEDGVCVTGRTNRADPDLFGADLDLRKRESWRVIAAAIDSPHLGPKRMREQMEEASGRKLRRGK